MVRGNRKRQVLFDIYSENLNFLIRNKKIKRIKLRENNKYICPICLGQFSQDDLNENSKNRLTLEDAPPKSLNGYPIALTCKSCNNTLGKNIDWHLAERLNELDFIERIKGSKKIGRFILGDIIINGEIQVHDKGVTKACHAKKNNNPDLLTQYFDQIKKNRNVSPTFEPKPSRVDPKKLQIALLKSAYILIFEKFGYAFLFNREYNRIRQQLLNPKEDIYPLECWFYGPFPRNRIGVPFITEKNLESIFVLFELNTKLSSRLFAVVLPLSNRKIEEIINELEARFRQNQEFNIEMMTFDDDYLRDITSVNLLLEWLGKFKNKF